MTVGLFERANRDVCLLLYFYYLLLLQLEGVFVRPLHFIRCFLARR
jgi:hypothetical protein